MRRIIDNSEVELRTRDTTTTVSDLLGDSWLNMDSKGPNTNTAGVYLLYNNDELVYVGKSKNNLPRRLATHRKSSKLFNSVKVYDDITELDTHILEVYLIAKYSPIYNRDCKGVGEVTVTLTIPDNITREYCAFEYWSVVAAETAVEELIAENKDQTNV